MVAVSGSNACERSMERTGIRDGKRICFDGEVTLSN
jgi:hypothetical protein